MALNKTGYVFGEFTDCESEQLLNDGKELVKFSPHPVGSSTGKSVSAGTPANDKEWMGPVFSFTMDVGGSSDIMFGSSLSTESSAQVPSSPGSDVDSKDNMKLLNVNANEFIPFNQSVKKVPDRGGPSLPYPPPPPPPPNHGVNPPPFTHPAPTAVYYPFYPPHWFPDPNYFFYPHFAAAAAAAAAHHGYRYPFPPSAVPPPPSSGPTPPPVPPPPLPTVTTGPQVAVVAPYRTTGADSRAQVIISDEKIRGVDYSVIDPSSTKPSQDTGPPFSPTSLPSSPPASSTHGDSGIDLGQSKSVSPPSVITISNDNHSDTDTTTTAETTHQPEDTCLTDHNNTLQTTSTHNDTLSESSSTESTEGNCTSTPVVNNVVLSSSEETTPTKPPETAEDPISESIPLEPVSEVTPSNISTESNTTPTTIASIPTTDLDLAPSIDSNATTPTAIKDSEVKSKADDDTELATRTNKFSINTGQNDSKVKQSKTSPTETDAPKVLSGSSSTKATSTVGISTNKSTKVCSPSSNSTVLEAIPSNSTNLKKSWASVASGFTVPTKTSVPSVTTAPSVPCAPPLKKPSIIEEKPKEVSTKETTTSKEQPPVLSEEDKARLKLLGGQIKRFIVSPEGHSVIPRGLRNTGSLCYIHAPLQALISCPSFYQLFTSLRLPYLSIGTYCSPTNVTDAMIQFVSQFHIYPQRDNGHEDSKNGFKKKRPLVYAEPFWPEFIYDMLARSKSMLSVKGRQEDAEEFLCWVLSKLHDEMVASVQSLDTPTEAESPHDGDSQDEDGEDDEWQEVGPRNKSVITRRTLCNESPISKMFGGKLQSTLHRQGMKETVTVEPFFSLQLDIQSSDIHTVKDALELMCTRESVSIAGNDKEVSTAIRRLTLAELPPYLILHIKRFYFDGNVTHKIVKQVEYDQDLEIPKDLIATTSKGKISQNQRTYKLWAVIYHQGKTVDKGHYICDVYHTNASSWIRINDNYVKTIPADFVFNPSRAPNPHAPYLLFYKQFEFSCINGRRM